MDINSGFNFFDRINSEKKNNHFGEFVLASKNLHSNHGLKNTIKEIIQENLSKDNVSK